MGQQQSRGLLLECIVVNDGTEFAFRSDPKQRVTALKAAIKSHAPDSIDCEDFALDLYAPRMVGGSGLEVTSEHLMQLWRGMVPCEVYKAMSATNFLVSRYRLSKYKFVDSGDDEAIQILVRKPGKLVIQPTWTQMPPEETPNLADGRLFCVIFNEAVKRLQNVHYRCFNASLGRPHGSVHVIPLLDNPSGTGKTVLATNYIQWCRELWPEAARGRFQKELCACHTIYPPVPDAEFRGRKITAQVANEALAEAVRRQLEPGTEMPMLSETSVNVTAFASGLVKSSDQIHVWFMRDEGGAGSLELFIQFYSDVLCTWMTVPQFYIVLTGCGSFLQLVQSGDPYCYHGLYFRPTEICEILCKTKVRRGCELILRERWGLKSEEDLAIAARLLFEKSSGYPQALSELLENHPTFASLTEAEECELSADECAKLHRALRTYKPLLRPWQCR